MGFHGNRVQDRVDVEKMAFLSMTRRESGQAHGKTNVFISTQKPKKKDGERLLVPRNWKNILRKHKIPSVHMWKKPVRPSISQKSCLGRSQSLHNVSSCSQLNGYFQSNQSTNRKQLFHTFNTCLCCERQRKRGLRFQHHNLPIAQDEFKSLAVLYGNA